MNRTFRWQQGCLNDYVRSYLKSHGRSYYNTLNGDVVDRATGIVVKAQRLHDDVFAVSFGNKVA